MSGGKFHYNWRGNMIDKYKDIRKALKLNPTQGPWEIERMHSGTIVGVGPCHAEEYAGLSWLEVSEKDAGFMVACYPETISSLLAERDELRKTLEAIEAMYNYEQSVGEAASALYEASGMARYALRKEY